jgi:hypothetical protein
MGRKQRYKTAAEKQRAYRERKKQGRAVTAKRPKTVFRFIVLPSGGAISLQRIYHYTNFTAWCYEIIVTRWTAPDETNTRWGKTRRYRMRGDIHATANR